MDGKTNPDRLVIDIDEELSEDEISELVQETYHMVGDSRMVDRTTGKELRNSLSFKDEGELVEIMVGELGKLRDGDVIVAKDRKTRFTFGEIRRRLLAQQRREEKVTPIFKVRELVVQESHQGPFACPECNGTGETYIDDRLVECPVCCG